MIIINMHRPHQRRLGSAHSSTSTAITTYAIPIHAITAYEEAWQCPHVDEYGHNYICHTYICHNCIRGGLAVPTVRRVRP